MGIMKFSMLSFVWKQPKIFNSVISFNFIDVMHYFLGKKISSEMFLHNNSMLANITADSSWMIRNVSKNVSVSFRPPTFPCGLAHLIFAFLRMFSPFNPRDLTFFKRSGISLAYSLQSSVPTDMSCFKSFYDLASRFFRHRMSFFGFANFLYRFNGMFVSCFS